MGAKARTLTCFGKNGVRVRVRYSRTATPTASYDPCLRCHPLLLETFPLMAARPLAPEDLRQTMGSRSWISP